MQALPRRRYTPTSIFNISPRCMTPPILAPERRRRRRSAASTQQPGAGSESGKPRVQPGASGSRRNARDGQVQSGRIVLKPGREKSLLRRHPWVFSGAIERVEGTPAAGETVALHSTAGEFLAFAAYSPHSQIRARVWSFDPEARIDEAFLADRLREAVDYRARILPERFDAVRLVHGESDGLPGVVIDRYGDTAVMQCSSAGAERWRDALASALVEQGTCRRVYERSDAEVRRLEGLEPRTGALVGDEPPDVIRVEEGSMAFLVDVRHGQKTGFFVDQRDNRAHVSQAARERRVLDVFSYTGGFTLAALAGGASHVTAIDSSASALKAARANADASGLDRSRVAWIEGDA
ncbi:MAG: class I SAM-dependent rRNA methyltransferase, partial [Betaproteobacteria bacterium]